jgi:hypothetical protein
MAGKTAISLGQGIGEESVVKLQKLTKCELESVRTSALMALSGYGGRLIQ